MVLSKGQEEALKISVQRHKNKEAYTCISGYAGSGKTTLVRYVIAALNLDPEDDVCYVAYTGKAATVLRQKGCANASTAHRLLYHARLMPNGTYKFVPKREGEIEYKLIVVDEVSMLPASMWQQLLKHKIHILALGDPGQLSPVQKSKEVDENNHILDHPHYFLDEIQRQALDSEIIRLSMWIREGKHLAQFPCQNQEVMLFNKYEITNDMKLWADQILCATNKTRNLINRDMRDILGKTGEPQMGDKIIGLTNHWDWASASGDWALTNGTIGTITGIEKQTWTYPSYILNKSVDIFTTQIEVFGGEDEFNGIPIDHNMIVNGEYSLQGHEVYNLMKKNQPIPFDFDYAYAITVWKAQGSEWDKVLGFEEWFPQDSLEHRQYLYTLATRAAKRLVIATK